MDQRTSCAAGRSVPAFAFAFLIAVTPACVEKEVPLVSMREVPRVTHLPPFEAQTRLAAAGFVVEFARPSEYCSPSYRPCSQDLPEALDRLVVDTQSGTQDKSRPAGSTVTLILAPPTNGITTE